MLKKQNRIVAKIKTKYWRTTHKFGIRLPHSIEEAIRLDAANGDKQWHAAIQKEITRVSVAWSPYDGKHTIDEIWKGKATDLIGYQEIKCHMIF